MDSKTIYFLIFVYLAKHSQIKFESTMNLKCLVTHQPPKFVVNHILNATRPRRSLEFVLLLTSLFKISFLHLNTGNNIMSYEGAPIFNNIMGIKVLPVSIKFLYPGLSKETKTQNSKNH